MILFPKLLPLFFGQNANKDDSITLCGGAEGQKRLGT